MPRLTTLVLSAVLCAVTATASAHEGTLLVSIDDAPATVEALRALTASAGGAVRSCSATTRLCVLDFPASPPASEVRALRGVRFVERDQPLAPRPPAEPDQRSPLMPLDPERFGDLWGTDQCPPATELELIRADEVWELGLDGSTAPVVAVIDTGFDTSHRDLEGRVAGQYDYGDLDDVAEVQPAVPIPHHGTFMAGLIAAVPDNGVGRAGVVPYGRLFLGRVVDRWNNQDLSFTIHALSDIADNHPEVRVVAYSLIPSVISPAYEQAVSALGEVGVLFVAAAGNCLVPNCFEADNDAYPLYPQSYPFEHILTVASTDDQDQLNPWSHYGRESVDLFAPGVDLCSLDISSETAVEVGSGTSYAAPLVAGAAALVLEAHPNLLPADLARVLRESAHPLPGLAHMVRSGGRLDVAAAVAAAVPRIAWPPDLVVDGVTDLSLSPVSNYGAAGEATVILFHGSEVQISLGDADLEATPFEVGDPIELPDVGPLRAPSPGLLIRGRLGEHSDRAIPLHLRGLELGRSQATVRLVLISDEGTLLGAPYRNPGSGSDPSGLEAHPFTIEVTATAPDDPPDDPPPDDPPPDDPPPDDPPADPPDDTPADLVGHDDPMSTSGGCSTAPGPGASPLARLAAIILG